MSHYRQPTDAKPVGTLDLKQCKMLHENATEATGKPYSFG